MWWQSQEGLPVNDRGFAYGDGVFETALVSRGAVWLLEPHRQRLIRGAVRLSINVDMGVVDTLISQAVKAAHGRTGVMKIVVTRGTGQRGYKPDPEHQATHFATIGPAVGDPADATHRDVTLRLCGTRLARQPLLAGMKHLNRLEQVLAAQELRPYEDEGLMLDTAGQVVEGISSNVLLVLDDKAVTPLLNQAGVAGVLRDFLMTQGPVPIHERAVSLDDVLRASEVCMLNSVAGVRAVTRMVLREGLEESREVRRRLASRARDTTHNFLRGPVTGSLQDWTGAHYASMADPR